MELPLEVFRLERPAEGLPPLLDWMTTMWSFLWSGADLRREPIDARTPSHVDSTVQIIKGWTRLSVVAYITLSLMETDLGRPGAEDALAPFDGVLRSAWLIPTNLTDVADKATLNAERLLLCYRGSERQRPSVLKLALRFEDSMTARKIDPNTPPMTDDKLLETLVAEYNCHKAVAGIKRWQLSDSTQSAMRSIIFGMTHTVRDLIRTHLNYNKWEQSCFTSDLLRCRRLFLNNKPQTGDDHWDRLLTVTEKSQKLLIQRMLSDFARKAKKALAELQKHCGLLNPSL